jgi:hypothetical protein
MPNLMKIRSEGAELFHSDGQAARQTDLTKLMVAFVTSANEPKTGYAFVGNWYSTLQDLLHGKVSALEELQDVINDHILRG